MKHNIQINKINNKYHFELWYCRKQAMGRSKSYDSYDLCLKGLDNFKIWLVQKNINNEGEYLKIKKINDKGFVYQFIDVNNIWYSSRTIETKYNCKKSMESTCKNIISAKLK